MPLATQPHRRFSIPARFTRYGRFLATALGGLVIMVGFASLAISGFEAHVINVTAKIEKLHCKEFEVRSKGFWKNHEELWILPQHVGDIFVDTPQKAKDMLNGSHSPEERLRAQLLALKFNMAHFGIGDAFVPGEMIHVSDLAHDADDLLLKDPPATAMQLKKMKDRVEKVNTAKKLSACPTPPPKNPCKHDEEEEDDFDNESTELSALHNNNNGNSGGNGGNGGDGGTIITGDACAHAEIINNINQNVTTIDLGGGSLTVINNNSAVVINQVNVSADTGGNTANGGNGGARGNGGNVTNSGDANAQATSSPDTISTLQSATPSPSTSASPTASPSPSPTSTATPTPSLSATPSPSSTSTPIPSPASSATPESTPDSTPQPSPAPSETEM